jgi:hypothetical protein
VVILNENLWASEGFPAVRDLPRIRRLSSFEANLFMSVVAERFFIRFPAPAKSIISAVSEDLSSDLGQRLSKLGHLLGFFNQRQIPSNDIRAISFDYDSRCVL